MKKKVIYIIISLILFLLILDYSAYLIMIKETRKYVPKETKLPSWYTDMFRMYDETSLKWYEANKNNGIFRNTAGINYKKPAIWLFGCSFAYGTSMVNGKHKEEDTFGYILSEYTKRPVYNKSYPSWGVQHMLYMLENDDIYKELPSPEYVIFTFISDHARRSQKLVYDAWSDGAYLRYKLNNNNELQQVKGFLVPLWKLHFVKLWLTFLEYNIRLNHKFRDKNFDLIEKMFVRSKEIIDNKYPDAKFIILKYNGNDGFDDWFIKTDRWNELDKYGFIVLDADKLIGKNLKEKEYTDADNYHPNKRAWIEISRQLSKKVIK